MGSVTSPFHEGTGEPRVERSGADPVAPYQLYLDHADAIAYQATLASFAPTFFAGAVEAITGHPRAAFLDGELRWIDLVLPEDLPHLFAATSRLLGVGDVIRHRYRIRRRDGALLWVEDVARVIRASPEAEPIVHGTVRDVTERVNAEETVARGHRVLHATRRLQERFIVEGEPSLRFQEMLDVLLSASGSDHAFILEAVNDGHRTRSFRLRAARPSLAPAAADSFAAEEPWAALVARSTQPLLLVGEGAATELRLPAWLPPCGALLSLPLLLGGELLGCILLGAAAPAYAPALVESLEPLFSTCTAFLAAIRAEGERKRAAEERQHLELGMLQAQKLESIGLLAAGIAHDFNNVLTTILGNAGLARLHLPAHAECSRFLVEIEGASRRAADLCRKLLAYAGKGSFAVEAVELGELVKTVVPLVENALSKKARVVVEVEGDLPVVEGDATQLQQLVLALLTNASDALGSDGGHIAVRVKVEVLSGTMGNGAGSTAAGPGRYVVLEVADSGCGMPREVLARIFDPFFTTKFPGRGLGLAAALGIVRQHGGALFVTSAEGSGSAFRVLLPALDGERRGEPHLRPNPDTRAPPLGRGTVLVVDDEPTVRAVAQRALERVGFAVRTAADGVAALELLDEHEDVTLIVADVTMPRLGGQELVRELRRRERRIPVLLMSGFAESDVMHEVQRGPGRAAFLPKPFTVDDLLGAVAALQAGPRLWVA